MFISIFLKIAFFALILNVNTPGLVGFVQPYKAVENTALALKKVFLKPAVQEAVLSNRSISLEKRYNNKFVNDVMKDNILLNIAYMADKVGKKTAVNWNRVTRPFHYQFSLKPKEVFAYHEDVLPKYEGKVAKTTNARFNAQENFKSDGYLVGDGVCHLASLIYWAAKDAFLDAFAPTNHDFAAIPEVPREFGVSIYSYPGRSSANASQNLYIMNNKSTQITFHFDYDGRNLRVSVSQTPQKLAVKI